jgi:hypothetical protein
VTPSHIGGLPVTGGVTALITHGVVTGSILYIVVFTDMAGHDIVVIMGSKGKEYSLADAEL